MNTATTLDYDAIARAISPAKLAQAIGAAKTSNGYRCPNGNSHSNGDQSPSLSIDRRDGRTVAFCHGCELKGTPIQVASDIWGVTLGDAAERLVRECGLGLLTSNGQTSGHSSSGLGELVEAYEYVDEAGEHLFEVVRFAFPKTFRQRVRHGSGHTWGLNGARRVLYKLPSVVAAVQQGRFVFVVEGEKDVHRLESLGLVATTCAGGAGKWRSSYDESLRGAVVAILPDNDDPGRNHAEDVARHLQGVAKDIRVVELPGLDAKGDVSDWLDNSGTLDELKRLVVSAPRWVPTSADTHTTESQQSQDNVSDSTSLDEILASTGLEKLDDEPPLDTVEACLASLKAAWIQVAPSQRPLLREGAVRALKKTKLLGARAIVDGCLGPAGKETTTTEGQGKSLLLEDPVRWPHEVDGAELLSDLVRAFARYAVLPEGGVTTLALWTLHAHSHDAAQISPLLNLTSPVKQCGKTTVLSLLDALVPRSLQTSNVSAAVLYRAIEKYRPTLLIDETDTFLDSDALRGIINSGHTRSGYVLRSVGDDHEPKAFSTWAPKALAGIKGRADTIEDRSITLQLRRKNRNEKVEPVRLDRLSREMEPLRQRAWTWAQDNLETLRDADPEVPELKSDRAADNWRALLAIADLAGGIWPEKARKAAVFLSGQGENEDAVAEILLSDIRDLFIARDVDRLTSAEIVEALEKMEERPWPEWKQGKPITTRQFARIVAPFGVRPTQFKIDGKNTRGYEREDFVDAFERYLPPSDPLPPLPSNQEKGFRPNSIRYQEGGGSGSESPAKPRQSSMVAMVADQNGENGAKTSNGTDESDDDYPEAERAGMQMDEDLEDDHGTTTADLVGSVLGGTE